MHLEVKPSKGFSFFCTFVYGATNKHERQHMLNHLTLLKNPSTGLWMVIGDFNCVANLNERVGQTVRLSEVLPLRNCMATCEIRDMKYNGRFDTWNNKQMGNRRVFSKIDRVMCNDDWHNTFPNAETIFLPEGNFDHSPILVRFFDQVNTKKPFKFFNFWTNNPDFSEIVENIWKTDMARDASSQINRKLK